MENQSVRSSHRDIRPNAQPAQRAGVLGVAASRKWGKPTQLAEGEAKRRRKGKKKKKEISRNSRRQPVLVP
jgi:hypothetical protein